MTDSTHVSGQALDRCICVHAEQNALLTAARFGIHVEGATLYTRRLRVPVSGVLKGKESVQAGIARVVYAKWYHAKYNDALQGQYRELARHLAGGERTRFEALGGHDAPFDIEGQPDPYASDSPSRLNPPPDVSK